MKNYHDIQGDGGSDVVGQVVALQAKIASNLAGVGTRLAVGSGKGGVGKSTITIELAEAFRAEGRRVAILDADLNGPSQARLAGVAATPALPGTQGLSMPRTKSGIGVVSLGSMVPEGHAVDFESVAPGDSFTWRATKEFALLSELLATVEWGELDVLVVDLPPGAERTRQFAEFLGPEANLLLVTIPSALSVGVVSRAIDQLRGTPNRLLGVVENMSGYVCPDCHTVKPLFETADDVIDLGVPVLGRIPFDPALGSQGDRGSRLLEGSEGPTVHALRRLGRTVLAELERANPAKDGSTS